ncbi:MAG: Ig-like domain-containing protein [Gemmatimonadaceae bacterium]
MHDFGIQGRAHRARRSRRFTQLAAYALLLASCDNPLGPDSADVGSVQVQPLSPSVAVGSSASLSATITDTQGKTLAGRRVFWSSQNPSIATVSQTGTVTGVTPGATTIAASSGGKSGVANVTVTARPVSVVRVTPNNTQLTVGKSTNLTAEALDAGSQTVAGKTFLWSSSNAAAVTVSSTGVVTALSAGTSTISAAVDGVSGSAIVVAIAVPIASISVAPSTSTVTVGSNTQLVASPLDDAGLPLTGRVVAWSSSDNAIATVSSTGLVVGLAPGKVTITASSEGMHGTASVTVSPVPIASISVAPSPVTIAAGGTVQLTATARDANDNVLGGRQFTWTSDQPAIATVSNAGLVTGATQGVVRVTAESDGETGVALVTVTPVAIARIDVTPPTVSLSIGGTSQLTATPKDGQGNALPGRQVTWITGAPSVATVSQTGLVTAVAGGNALVFAASEGISGSSSITVSSSALTLTPGSANVNVGGQLLLTATLRNGSGVAVPGQTISFTSSDVTAATVSPASATSDSNGQVFATVSGVAVGATTVTATSGSSQATSTIQVASVPVASVTVTPSPVSVPESQSTQLTATARDAAGNILTGRTIVWSSNNANVSVSATGLVTAVGNSGGQSATITATAPGSGAGGTSPSGTSTVSVTFLPVSSVTISPSPATVTVSGTTQLTATLLSATGSTLSATGRTVTWGPSANAAVATVNATGRVTGVATGTTTVPVTASSPGQSVPASSNVTINVSNVPVASVTVTPGPTATVHVGALYVRTFTAVTKDASGNVLTGRTIIWSSSDASKATVDPLTGVVTGVASGPVTITATSESVPGTSSVTVDLVTIASVDVTPNSFSLVPPQTQTLSTTPKDSAGNTISGSALGGRSAGSWTSSQPAVATVNGSGVVTAVAQGTASISTTYSGPNGGSGSATANVQAPVANVVIASFNPDSVIAPGTVAGQVTVSDASSNPLSGRTVNFASSNPLRATVTASGTSDAAGHVNFTVTGASGAGAPTISVNITATSETITSAPAAIDALNAVNSVSLTAASDSVIGPSGTITTTVTLRDQNSQVLTGRPTSYASNNTGVATVNSSGVVTIVGLGSAVITATAEGKNGTFTVRALAPVASVTMTSGFPGDSTIGTGSQQSTVVLKDASNNTLTGRPISYASSNTSVATVNGTGVVTVVGTGTTNLTATSEGVTSAAVALRSLEPVNSVAFNPTSVTVTTGGGQATSTITLTGASSAVLAGRQCSITSNGPSATVSPASAVSDVNGQIVVTITGQASTGTPTITASCEAKQGTLSVTVQ